MVSNTQFFAESCSVPQTVHLPHIFVAAAPKIDASQIFWSKRQTLRFRKLYAYKSFARSSKRTFSHSGLLSDKLWRPYNSMKRFVDFPCPQLYRDVGPTRIESYFALIELVIALIGLISRNTLEHTSIPLKQPAISHRTLQVVPLFMRVAARSFSERKGQVTFRLPLLTWSGGCQSETFLVRVLSPLRQTGVPYL